MLKYIQEQTHIFYYSWLLCMGYCVVFVKPLFKALVKHMKGGLVGLQVQGVGLYARNTY